MRRPAAVLLVALVISSTTLRAQDHDTADAAFRDGLRAIDDKRWAQAVTSLLNAIRVAPEESSRKVGQRFGVVGGTEYLPWFFLGKAYLGQNDCTNALDAWARSEQAGVIAKVDQRHVRELQAGSRACEGRGFLPNAKLEAVVAGVTKQLDTARSTADDLDGRARTKADLFTADRRNRLNQAREQIKQAESRLESGRRSRLSTEFTEAQAAAARATTLVVALRTEFIDETNAVDSLQGQLAELEQGIEHGTALERDIDGRRAYLNDGLTSTRQRGQQALAGARRAADAARAAGARANVSAVKEARASVTEANGLLQKVFDELVALETVAIGNRRAAVLRQSRDRFRLADQAVGTLDARLKARPSVEPSQVAERQAIVQRIRTARRQLEAASASGPLEAIEEAGKVADLERTRLVAMTEAFGPLTLEERGVNARLVDATRLLFNGDYAQVLKVLQPAEPFPADMLFLEHVHLLRAAASHAQYLKGGRTDAALAEAARAEIGALKGLNPAFQPDSRVFSPRFLEFFRTVPAVAAPVVEPAVAGAR